MKLFWKSVINLSKFFVWSISISVCLTTCVCRTLQFTWVSDTLMIAEDPFGRYGPSLHQLLRFWGQLLPLQRVKVRNIWPKPPSAVSLVQTTNLKASERINLYFTSSNSFENLLYTECKPTLKFPYKTRLKHRRNLEVIIRYMIYWLNRVINLCCFKTVILTLRILTTLLKCSKHFHSSNYDFGTRFAFCVIY